MPFTCFSKRSHALPGRRHRIGDQLLGEIPAGSAFRLRQAGPNGELGSPARTGNRELTYFAIALTIPALFFSTLPWNPDFATWEYLDAFFGADIPRVFALPGDSDAVDHYRDRVHPYFSLLGVTSPNREAVGDGGRRIPCVSHHFWHRRRVSVLAFPLSLHLVLTAFAAVVLLLSTLTVRIWSTLPETYLLGLATLMLGLNLARVGGNAAVTLMVTLSGTITNAALGLLYMLQIAREAYGLEEDDPHSWHYGDFSAIILSLQKVLYPTSVHFFDIFALREEQRSISASYAHAAAVPRV